MNKPSTLARLALAAILLLPPGLHSQDPNLAPDDLKYTKEAIEVNHLIARVSMRMAEDKYSRFRYDRYPDMKRVTGEDGVEYVQLKGKAWVKSKDWGKTGTPVKKDKADELEMFVSAAEIPMGPTTARDKSQGSTVWRFIEQTKENDVEFFTYEMSRETPKADGIYPKYTFIKYPKDEDGKLLLYRFAAQVRSGEKLIPIEIQYGLMIILPAGSVTIEDGTKKTTPLPKATKKK